MKAVKNTTFLEVTDVRHLDDYKLWLQFNTGETRIVDLKNELIGEVYAPLKNIDYFKQCRITYNTIEWSNGADFAPEYLYELGSGNDVELNIAADLGFEYKTKKQ